MSFANAISLEGIWLWNRFIFDNICRDLHHVLMVSELVDAIVSLACILFDVFLDQVTIVAWRVRVLDASPLVLLSRLLPVVDGEEDGDE